MITWELIVRTNRFITFEVVIWLAMCWLRNENGCYADINRVSDTDIDLRIFFLFSRSMFSYFLSFEAPNVVNL